MSIGKFKKDELRSIADELKLVVPDNAKVLDLRELIQEKKAFKTKNVPEKLKPEILLNILGEKANNLMIYLRDEDLIDYNKLKAIVLKEFQPTPYECLNQFKKAQKLPSESYVQFASRLSANFNYYCQLREVNDFKSVCELVISDKIIETLDRELNTHISIKQGEMWFKPQDLARECDIFISSKGKIREQNLFPKFKRNETYNHRGAKNISSINLSSVKNVKCFCCKSREFHPLYSCSKFKSLSVSERVDFVKANHLCFKCFSPNCSVKTCCAKNCFCGKPHNRLIHFPKPGKESVALNQTVQRSVLNPLADVFGGPGGSNCVVPPQGENEENKSLVATSFLKNKTRTVLLSSVQCFLRDKYGLLHEVRALLDVGSQSNFITKDCADRLQLKNEKINLLVSCLNESTMTINGGVTTSIFNGDLSFKKELNLLVVRRITDLTPSQIINVSLDMPNEIKLADYKFNIPGKIDVLLGAEIFYELLRPGQIYCGDSRLLLQNTVFGYVVSGSVGDE
ncbi:integrase catalytic domain-containing protein, partial [Trichonephila clavipes]